MKHLTRYNKYCLLNQQTHGQGKAL